MTAIARDAMGKKGERSGRMVPCEVCGKECYCPPSGSRKHCGNACRMIALRMGNRITSDVNVRRTGKACLWCGKEVVRKLKRGPTGKWNAISGGKSDRLEYCDKSCAKMRNWHGSKEQYVAKVIAGLIGDLVEAVLYVAPQCLECGKPVHGRKGSKLCSVACQIERGRRHTRERYEREHGVKLTPVDAERQCIHCGELMPREQRNGRGRILCHSCCYTLKRGDPHKMRAIRYGVEYQDIDRREVFERDGWRCQLCQSKVNQKALRSKATGKLHPRNAHLDHIVPFAAGGAHTIDNVQCSCLRCNLRKGKRRRGQKRLF